MTFTDIVQLLALVAVVVGISTVVAGLAGLQVAIGVASTLTGGALWFIGQELDRKRAASYEAKAQRARDALERDWTGGGD